MWQISKLATLIVCFAMISAGLTMFGSAIPPVPDGYTGTVTEFVSGIPVPDGIVVKVCVDGVYYDDGSGTITGGSYSLLIGGDDPDSVDYKEGALELERMIFWAGDEVAIQTALFTSGGGYTTLDLQIEPGYSPMPIVMNEIMVNQSSGDEWIELYNPTGSAVALDDYKFEDNDGWSLALFGETIPASGYLQVNITSGNQLDDTGDEIKLVWNCPWDWIAEDNDVVIDRVEYGTPTGTEAGHGPDNTILSNAVIPGQGESLALQPDGDDNDDPMNDFEILTTPTPGATNGETFTPHLPIRINSNIDFDEAHGVVNWATGDGTQGNPWIIEGWDINGTGYGYCIYIGNTTDYFEVRDCYLHGADGGFSERGLFIYNVMNGRVFNNIMSDNYQGLKIELSSSCTLSNNTAYSNTYAGFQIYYSNNNNFTYNNISNNNYCGIFIRNSANNIIANCTVVSNLNYGIWIFQANFNTVTNNNVSLCLHYGFWIDAGANNNTIKNNNVTSNDEYGIFLDTTTGYNTIRNNIVSDNPHGIYLDTSNGNIIENNNASSNTQNGIYLDWSSGNIIANNTASDNSQGIRLYFFSRWNILDNNTASNNYCGINLDISSSNKLTNNTVMYNNPVSNNNIDIQLYRSSSCTLANNEMADGGLSIWGNQLSYWNTHTIDASNTVNGKPIYYRKNQTGGTVPEGGGQVILANCTGITVKNHNVSDVLVGIRLGYSNFNSIANITAMNNYYGYDLFQSSNNTLTNSTLTSNGYGFNIRTWCHNNTITNNNASNGFTGIYIGSASNHNTLTNNTAANNWNGIALGLSNNNTIYHNNLINNTFQGTDDDNNSWDNGYPSGGNYWSTWATPDTMGGVLQDLPGSDGIVDIPYNISGGANQDRYPVTTPNGWLNITYIGPVHNIDSGEYFPTIQTAIDDSDTLGGHTIEVSAGTYNENVVVNKMVTLVGAGSDVCTIDGGGSGDIVLVTADGVTITGFTVTNGQTGITIDHADNCLISYNTVSLCTWYGIYLTYSLSNTIANNTVYDSNNAIYLGFSNTNTILNNTASSNYGCGIFLVMSNGNIIYHNNFIDNFAQGFANFGSSNFLDNGYPSGGNYWSDYPGVDNFNGPLQDIPGSDGIGDTFYSLVNDQDNYPLMLPTDFEPLFYNISLSEGWNLISLPYAQYFGFINQVLNSIDGKWDYIQAYDAFDTADHWKTNSTIKPDQLNDLKRLNHKQGFWINITEPNVDLMVVGYEPISTGIRLYAGWNLVGYPTVNNTTTIADAFAGTGYDLPVETFNATAPYRLISRPPMYVMQPGEAYWVHVPADTLWVVDW